MSSDFCNNARERSRHVVRGPIDGVLNELYPYKKEGTIIEYEGQKYRRQWFTVRSRSGKTYGLHGTWQKVEPAVESV